MALQCSIDVFIFSTFCHWDKANNYAQPETLPYLTLPKPFESDSCTFPAALSNSAPPHTETSQITHTNTHLYTLI